MLTSHPQAVAPAVLRRGGSRRGPAAAYRTAPVHQPRSLLAGGALVVAGALHQSRAECVCRCVAFSPRSHQSLTSTMCLKSVWRRDGRRAVTSDDGPGADLTEGAEALSEAEALDNSFGVPGSVYVEEGLAGMTRVVLTHPSGSTCGIYLLGANVTTWTLANGSSVLYIRDDAFYDGVTPIEGGIPISWPQCGRGGDFPGGVLGQPPLQLDGFAKEGLWELVGSGRREGEGDPFVILRLKDSERTRAQWPHAFLLQYEVTLGERDLSCTLVAANPGPERLAFSAALRAHIGVEDATCDKVLLLGLMGSPYFDCAAGGPQPRVAVDLQPVRRLEGATDMWYVNTQPRVALEVGTGCTVFVENTDGFTDHAVWNPGPEVPSYPNFVCVQPAVAAAPVKLGPGEQWQGTATFFIRDVMLSDKVAQGFEPAPEPVRVPSREPMVKERFLS